MKDVGSDDFITAMFESLEKTLPAIFARKEAPKLLGGTIASGTLANFGHNGPPYVLSGRHAIYEKKSFLSWYKLHIFTKITKNSSTYNKK